MTGHKGDFALPFCKDTGADSTVPWLQVARTAKMMITQMGFSKKLGQVAWSGGGGPSFLGQSMGQPADCSGQTSDEIDNEVKELVNRAYRWRPSPDL